MASKEGLSARRRKEADVVPRQSVQTISIGEPSSEPLGMEGVRG